MSVGGVVGRALLALALLAVLTTVSAAQGGAASTPDRLAKLEKDVAQAQSSADNAWMLTSSALVLMMTGPGLALFYGGLVRKKNVLEHHDAELYADGRRHRALGHSRL